MNFMFEWQKRYLTSERGERVRYRFCHENIKFIWRPDVSEIANFYFIVFEKSSKFYKSPFVFTENTKHPCPEYRNTN